MLKQTALSLCIGLTDLLFTQSGCTYQKFRAPARLALTLLALFHCMVRHGTVRYGSLLGGFPLGTVPGT